VTKRIESRLATTCADLFLSNGYIAGLPFDM
jgi:hypothetical protein